MNLWDEQCLKEDKKNDQKHAKVKNIIDGQNLIIFFRKGDSVFGAPEESRIVFARMKNPSDDEPLADDSNFSAFDLTQALNGNSTENLFSLGDLPSIDVITRDQAEDALMQCPDGGPASTIELEPRKSQKDAGTQAIALKDKE
jgi:hypothetical protein